VIAVYRATTRAASDEIIAFLQEGSKVNSYPGMHLPPGLAEQHRIKVTKKKKRE
jgi:hypothetical protein